jgi:CBS domain-containing protein
MPVPDASLFLHPAREFVARPPVTVGVKTSVRELARLMARERIGSVVIVDDGGAPAGIVTDRDLRDKVVAQGRDPATTVAADIMSAPLITVTSDVYGFEALLEMTRRGIHHLVVMDTGRLVGVVSSGDFLRHQAAHPVVLAREIETASSTEDLARLGARVTALVRRLVDEGGTPYDIGRIVAELNERMVQRVLALVEAGLDGGAPPPVAFSWLSFGSEARREQTLRTDQDNGLVYADPPEESRAAVEAYFTRFTAAVNAALIAIGFPECPGRIMASEPALRQPVGVWTERFRRWIRESGPEEILAACIFFDVRPVGGTDPLAAKLREVIRTEAPDGRRFLGFLARDVVDRPVALTLLGNVRVARSGSRRGTVDVKGGASLQLVGAARLHALALGSDETNTVDRFRAASVAELYPEEQCREITDAYQHLTRIRLVHQLACLERGEPPDNHVNPRRLSHTDALLFLDALKTVTRVQAGLRERYATDFLL